MLAGELPDDVKQILYHHPEDAPTILRETFGQYASHATSQKARDEKKAVPQEKHLAKPLRKKQSELIHTHCFDWLEQRVPNSIHAVVTDPPYGLKEYTTVEKQKLRRGRGGVWRIPPTFDGCTRSPLPRFTVLTNEDKDSLKNFFTQWATRIQRVLVPGGHIFIATNPLLSHLVYTALEEAGFEKRTEERLVD